MTKRLWLSDSEAKKDGILQNLSWRTNTLVESSAEVSRIAERFAKNSKTIYLSKPSMCFFLHFLLYVCKFLIYSSPYKNSFVIFDNVKKQRLTNAVH